MTNEKKVHRMWMLVCEGVGPISTCSWSTRRAALLCKQIHYNNNDSYQIRRVKVTMDPEKRRGRK